MTSKKFLILRNFNYTNIHRISCNLDKLTFFYTKKNNNSLKSLIKISTFLELTTGQRSVFIRSNKSLAAQKLRKGYPIGSKVTLRKSVLKSFLFKLIWQVLPNIKNFYNKKKCF
jgi:large subunit ribosomal protein L5